MRGRSSRSSIRFLSNDVKLESPLLQRYARPSTRISVDSRFAQPPVHLPAVDQVISGIQAPAQETYIQAWLEVQGLNPGTRSSSTSSWRWVWCVFQPPAIQCFSNEERLMRLCDDIRLTSSTSVAGFEEAGLFLADADLAALRLQRPHGFLIDLDIGNNRWLMYFSTGNVEKKMDWISMIQRHAWKTSPEKDAVALSESKYDSDILSKYASNEEGADDEQGGSPLRPRVKRTRMVKKARTAGASPDRPCSSSRPSQCTTAEVKENIDSEDISFSVEKAGISDIRIKAEASLQSPVTARRIRTRLKRRANTTALTHSSDTSAPSSPAATSPSRGITKCETFGFFEDSDESHNEGQSQAPPKPIKMAEPTEVQLIRIEGQDSVQKLVNIAPRFIGGSMSTRLSCDEGDLQDLRPKETAHAADDKTASPAKAATALQSDLYGVISKSSSWADFDVCTDMADHDESTKVAQACRSHTMGQAISFASKQAQSFEYIVEDESPQSTHAASPPATRKSKFLARITSRFHGKTEGRESRSVSRYGDWPEMGHHQTISDRMAKAFSVKKIVSIGSKIREGLLGNHKTRGSADKPKPSSLHRCGSKPVSEEEASSSRATQPISVGKKRFGMHVYRVVQVGLNRLVVSKGDITTFSGDAIVNAANESAMAGGGVAAAITRAAGAAMETELKALPEVRPMVRIPVGQARITNAGKLRVERVIHAVGPQYTKVKTREKDFVASKWDPYDEKLKDAYQASIELAVQNSCWVIAFACLSTGAFMGDRGLDTVLTIGLSCLNQCLLKHNGPPVEVHMVTDSGRVLGPLIQVFSDLLPV